MNGIVPYNKYLHIALLFILQTANIMGSRKHNRKVAVSHVNPQE